MHRTWSTLSGHGNPAMTMSVYVGRDFGGEKSDLAAVMEHLARPSQVITVKLGKCGNSANLGHLQGKARGPISTLI